MNSSKAIYQLFRLHLHVSLNGKGKYEFSLSLAHAHAYTHSVTNSHQSHTLSFPLLLLGDRQIKRSAEHCSKYKHQVRSQFCVPLLQENKGQAAVTKVIVLYRPIGCQPVMGGDWMNPPLWFVALMNLWGSDPLKDLKKCLSPRKWFKVGIVERIMANCF